MRILALMLFCLVTVSMPNIAGAQSVTDKNKANSATNKIGGDAQLLSHFVERGLSMSNGNPALNASFLFNLGSQVRLGFWGSNISNLSAADDNFWFKFLGEFDIRFGSAWQSSVYISDNHFYKSDVRNGQRIGVTNIYYLYQFTFEWMSNLEGSKGNAEYVNFGKYFFITLSFTSFTPYISTGSTLSMLIIFSII